MADIDIFSIQPHQVSRDLRGYSVFFYGGWKTGKTTIASKFPNALLLAFEKGYNALAGVRPQPINSWAEFKKVLRQLKEARAKEMFETIIVDTADIAYDYCTKYICDNAQRSDGGYGVDSISDIPFGKGYGMVEKEFDTALRSIVQMDYGLVIISHETDKTFTDEAGNQYNKIVPTLDKRANNICARMCDIVGYSRAVTDKDGNLSTKLFMRGTPRYEAGSRFKYTPDFIDFSYENLVNAIATAIDKQAEEDGAQYFTDTRKNAYEDTTKDLNFDELMKGCNDLIKEMIGNNSDEVFKEFYQPRIVQITDRYLGRGQKMSQCSREQVEALSLIYDDLLLLSKETKSE
jgi:hypothetical protein